MKEKTYVEDVDRNMYDFRNDEKDAYRIKNGLTEDIVEKISEEKHDPEWMHDFRLNSLKVYNEMKVPDWGPSIEGFPKYCKLPQKFPIIISFPVLYFQLVQKISVLLS